MKKVLLGLTLVATTLVSNAQFKIWHAYDGTGFTGAGNAYLFGNAATVGFTVDTATAFPYNISFSGTAGNAAYYISGFGNGSYAANGDKQAFGYTADNFATDKFFMDVKTTGTKIKVQFTTITNGTEDADIYGYEFDLSGNSSTAMTTMDVAMNQFSKIVADNPDGINFLTSTLAAKIGKIEFVFVKTANGGTGAASAELGSVSIGSAQLTSTASASSIASSKLFPNPATSEASISLELKSASALKVVLSDVMGKEVMTVADGNYSTLNTTFSTEALNAGVYNVTYYVNGAVAKTELLMKK
ncbi:MAG: T9SS type A sorting domain-containing protein [Cytophagaceae bacterium]|jgi:hypothetical protein|nr:T9SS type A sorting domain-containing protein [Cytophagaceae bacterium]